MVSNRPISFPRGLFSGAFAVSFREGRCWFHRKSPAPPKRWCWRNSPKLVSYLGLDYDGHLAPWSKGSKAFFSGGNSPNFVVTGISSDAMPSRSLTSWKPSMFKKKHPNKWESRYPIVRGKSQLLLSTLKKKRWIFWEHLLNHMDPVDTTWCLL